MKITVANKKLDVKPSGDEEKKAYFSGLVLKQRDIDIEEMEEIVSEGVTVSYIYKDEEFTRKAGYMKRNYVGTQFIAVDIDRCGIPASEFVKGIEHMPTIFHTTFSNMTEEKGFKHCFHLIYVFDEMIYGEEDYAKVFDILTADYSAFVDRQAKDPHRMFFTSSGGLPGFEYGFTGVIYKAGDFIRTAENGIGKDQDKDQGKDQDAEKSFMTDPDAEKSFMTDFNTLRRSDFIEKYGEKYPLITSTPVDFNGDGYADVSGTEYYELESMFRFDPATGKAVHSKVRNGKRTSALYARACKLVKIIPDVTLEWLITAVTKDVYENYDNSDKELNNSKIYSVCKEVFKNRDIVNAKKSGKKIRIDTGFWAKNDCTPIKAVGVVRKLINTGKILELYDFGKPIEENLRELEAAGVKTTKRRLKAVIEENGCEILTEKEMIRKKVIELGKKGMTTREIEVETGISRTTVSRILKDYRKTV